MAGPTDASNFDVPQTARDKPQTAHCQSTGVFADLNLSEPAAGRKVCHAQAGDGVPVLVCGLQGLEYCSKAFSHKVAGRSGPCSVFPDVLYQRAVALLFK